MSNGKAKYEPLETGDGSDNEANGRSHTASAQLAAARKLERRARVMLYASIGLVVIAACLLFSLPVLRRQPSELECAQVVSPYCEFLVRGGIWCWRAGADTYRSYHLGLG